MELALLCFYQINLMKTLYFWFTLIGGILFIGLFFIGYYIGKLDGKKKYIEGFNFKKLFFLGVCIVIIIIQVWLPHAIAKKCNGLYYLCREVYALIEEQEN